MLNSHKTLTVFAFLAFILISMPYQEAYAAVDITYTGVTSTTTTITLTFSETMDENTDSSADWAISSGQTVLTTTFTDGTTGPFVLNLDSAINSGDTPTVSYSEGGNIDATLDTDTIIVGGVVMVDNTAPSMDSALVISSTTIDVTFSEDLDDSGSVIATDFTLDQSLVVLSISENTAGVITITTTTAIADGATPIVTLAGDVDDASAATNTLSAGPTVTAGAASGAGQGSGCASDCTAPTLGVNVEGDRFVTNGFTYNGKSTDVESFFTPYPLITVDVGNKNTAQFKIYENYGPDNIRHFSLAFGLGADQIISESKAMIELDINFAGIETVTITDPENALDNVRVRTSTGSCAGGSTAQCLIVTVDHTFRAPLDFNIVSTDVWDNERNSWQNYFNHGIEVVGESLNPPNEYFGIYKGELIHLIETGKNTAIDADGNIWTFDNTWIKDYIYKGKIEDPISSQGYDRDHVKFNILKQEQEQAASALMEKYYKTSFSQEPAFNEINDIYSTYVTQGFDRDHPDFAAYQQEQVQKALSFLKQHFPKYASESFEEINDIYFYEYSEQNKPDSETMKYNINQAVKKAQQTIQEYYKSSYQ